MPDDSARTAEPCQAPIYPDPIPDVIPFGSLCIFMGPPKRGKTALLADWFARWRDGRSICGLPTHAPTALGILTTDHKWHLNQAGWFAKAGFPDVAHYSLRDQPHMAWRQLRIPARADDILNRGLDALKLPPGGLVAIDVMGPFLTSRLNDYAEVVGGLGTISQMLDVRQLTGIGLSHMGKQKGDSKDQYKDPFERILGSGAQIGFSDTMFYLLGPKDLDQPHYEVGWQPTHAPSGTFRFKRDVYGMFIPATDQQGPLGVSSYDAPVGVDAVLVDMPEAAPGWPTAVLLAAISQQCGVKKRRSEALASQMLHDGRIIRITQGHYIKAKVS